MKRVECRSCNDRGEILTHDGSIYRFYKRCEYCDAWKNDPYWRNEMGLEPIPMPDATPEETPEERKDGE